MVAQPQRPAYKCGPLARHGGALGTRTGAKGDRQNLAQKLSPLHTQRKKKRGDARLSVRKDW